MEHDPSSVELKAVSKHGWAETIIEIRCRDDNRQNVCCLSCAKDAQIGLTPVAQYNGMCRLGSGNSRHQPDRSTSDSPQHEMSFQLSLRSARDTQKAAALADDTSHIFQYMQRRRIASVIKNDERPVWRWVVNGFLASLSTCFHRLPTFS